MCSLRYAFAALLVLYGASIDKIERTPTEN
jgi:hypothetical protein